MKKSFTITIYYLAIFCCLINLVGCGAVALDVPNANQLSAKAPEKKSFISKWVRDRSKDYITAETLQPLHLRNNHLAEKFTDDYKIPGEY